MLRKAICYFYTAQEVNQKENDIAIAYRCSNKSRSNKKTVVSTTCYQIPIAFSPKHSASFKQSHKDHIVLSKTREKKYKWKVIVYLDRLYYKQMWNRSNSSRYHRLLRHECVTDTEANEGFDSHVGN